LTVVERANFLEKGAEEIIKIFNRGLDKRLMRSTDVNETSSRSHLLFQLMIDSERDGIEYHGRLMFIDLAGSERVATINMTEPLYEEALFINESLKYLGYIVRWLAAGNSHSGLNFNLNRLTSLLSEYIGGAAHTLMLINISPSEYDIEATLDSLKFAEETGRIKNKQGEMSKNFFKLALRE
jgi:Kinesin motor domain